MVVDTLVPQNNTQYANGVVMDLYNNFSILDILLLAVGVYVLLKLGGWILRRNSNNADTPGNGGQPGQPGQSGPSGQGGPRAQNGQSGAPTHDPWAGLRSTPASTQKGDSGRGGPKDAGKGPAAQGPSPKGSSPQGAAVPGADRPKDAPRSDIPLPPGFDTPEFLRGAKLLFARMQESWDRRDLDDIAQFATPEALDDIRQEAAADPGPSSTTLLLVQAELVSASREDGDECASVLFDVLLRDEQRSTQPVQLREVWDFRRSLTQNGTWRLDGIQQVQ